MKKVYVIILMFFSLLCFGCQNNQNVGDSETKNVNGNNTEKEGEIIKNTEIVTNTNNKSFSFSEDKIVNLNKVTQMFDSSDIHGLTCNYDVENQLEDDSVPEEIIDVLISENDRDETNDELYKNYLAVNYIAVDIEDADNTDFGNCVYYDLIKNRGIIDIMQVDIDYDSEYEYLVEYNEGSDGKTAFSVFKNEKKEIKEVCYFFEEYAHYELLELNDRYYILAGNKVTYYDLSTGGWRSVNLGRTITDFHKHEFYSESQLEEDIIFQDVDLVHKENWEQQKSFTFEFICGNPLVLKRQIEEEAYYYVCTDFQDHERKNQDDRLLFIIKANREGDFKIIKAYYLEAECHLFVENVDGTDKSDENINFDNPYFYSQTECFLSADIQYMDVETVTTINGELELQWLKEYNNGNLYKLMVEPDGNITDCLGTERLNIYFYVTSDKIYRLWSFVVRDGKLIEFYNNDALLIETLNTDEKLVENGELVCCMEDKTNELEPSEVGKHVTIVQQGEQITYNRVDIGESGNREFYETFVWAKGKGLVEYRSGYRMEADILYIDNIFMK